MNNTDFLLKLNGFPIKRARKKLLEIQQLNTSLYIEYIEDCKKKIVEFHLKNNSFYRKKCNAIQFFNWEDLPVLTKLDLQIPLKDRLSNGYLLNSVYINKTSGSTGNPFHFAKDKFSHALTWEIIKNRFDWHNLYGKKQARFYGLPKSFLSKFKERIKDFFMNRYRFDVFDLSDEAFNKWFLKFKLTSFVYLNGYTTVIVAFANYLKSKNVILKDICPSLKACVVTSEMCHKDDLLLLEKQFGVPVINEYGASELDLIAFQNTKKQWVLNTETLFIEILDPNNKPLPYGETGKIIITSLYNKAHPFIRYELGDLGSINKTEDGILVLEKLEGRKEDIILLPNGKKVPGLAFYYITKSVMSDCGTVKEIKAIQKTLDTFEIQYVATSVLTQQQEQKIKKALSEYLIPNLDILFLRFEHLKRSKSGKLKQFTSLIKQQ